MAKEYIKGKSVKLSENFTSKEFDCKGKGCCNKTLIDEKLIDILQKIRNHFGKPITINSGYRCKTHNKKIGGAGRSKHMDGTAADIKVKDVTPAEVAKFAESIGVLGIGLYETDKDGYFVHIDTRTIKGFWYGQAEEKRTTFGGAPEPKITVNQWQIAAIYDGFSFPKFGPDGKWGAECEAVAKKAVCKNRLLSYKYENLTRLVQRVVGVKADGLFGSDTKKAVKVWQKANGLTADGVVGIDTWKKILGIN